MKTRLKSLISAKTNALNALLSCLVLLGLIFPLEPQAKQTVDLRIKTPGEHLVTLQNNALTAIVTPPDPKITIIRKFRVMATAYSSTPEETDDTPFTTAANTQVRDGVIANNLLPFGTKVRIPDLYGDKIFTVEDRMNRRKSDYQIDIWFAETHEAIRFGAKLTNIEVIKEN